MRDTNKSQQAPVAKENVQSYVHLMPSSSASESVDKSAVQSDVSKHAKVRIDARGFTLAAVEAVLKFGRLVYVRGAAIFAIGRKEVMRFAKDGIKLSVPTLFDVFWVDPDHAC